MPVFSAKRPLPSQLVQRTARRRMTAAVCAVESLETRVLFSVFTVNTLSDNTTSDNFLSLREAVSLINNTGNANAAVGHSLTTNEAAQIDTTQPYGTNDTIVFDSTIAGGTINFGSEMGVNSAMTIDGGTSEMTFDGQSGGWRAFSITSTGDLSLDHATVSHFVVQGGNGGAINIASGTLSASHSTFSNNAVTGNAGGGGVGFGDDAQGGAIYVDSGTVTLDQTTFTSNAATGGSANASSVAFGGQGQGGAVGATTATITVTNSTFTSNSATGGATNAGSNAFGGDSQGGALYTTSGTLTVTGSTFSGNTASGGTAGGATVKIGGGGHGGAITTASSTTSITNSTLTNNTAAGGIAGSGGVSINGDGYGGGVYMNIGQLTMNFDTLSANNGTGRQIQVDNNSGDTFELDNSILGQADNSQIDLVANGGTSTGSNNLIRNTSATGMGVISSADPLLSALASNGGPTQTMAMQTGSPAIDAAGVAGSVTTDQRGDPRVIGTAADLGAYELITYPVFTSADSATFTAGVTNSFTISTAASPTATLSETGTLPAGVTFTDNGDGTATLAGTVDAAASGPFVLTIGAVNGVTPDGSQTFTLSVDHAPAITSDDHATFLVNQAGSFTVTTSGYPDATVTKSGALPSGVSFVDNGDGTATISGMATSASGSPFTLTIVASNGTSPNANQTFTLNLSSISAEPIVTGGTNSGGDTVVKNSDGSARFTIADPFTTRDPTRVATGDITGDGIGDIIMAAGAGGRSMINIYDGTDGTLVHSFAAFSSSYSGPIYVASGDVNNDGHADIVVGKGYEKGANASFKVFSGLDYSLMANITAFGSSSDSRVAVGDIDGDGFADVVVMQGASTGASKARSFSGASLATNHVTILSTITPFGSGYDGGGFVALGDVNADGTLDIILSRTGNSQATISVFSGVDSTQLTTFNTPSGTGGILASHDTNSDGYDDILVGVTDSTGKHVKVFSGLDNSLLDTIDLDSSAGLFVA